MEQDYKVIGISKIYETSKYDDFVSVKYNIGNRDIRHNSQYIELEKHIKKYGQIIPLIVKQTENKKLAIADGQHRYECLKKQGKPVKFIINNEISLSEIISASSVTIHYTQQDFISIGAKLGYPIFETIYRLYGHENNVLAITSILEIIFTYAINNKKKLFKNDSFGTSCRQNLDNTLEKYNILLSDEMLTEMYILIEYLQQIAEILGIRNKNPKKTLKVNLVREIMRYYINWKFYDVPIDEILEYLKKDNEKNKTHREALINLSTDKEFNMILRDIAQAISMKR